MAFRIPPLKQMRNRQRADRKLIPIREIERRIILPHRRNDRPEHDAARADPHAHDPA